MDFMKETLLIVDDELNVLRSLKRLLANEGYEVFIATSPNEGLELLAKHPIQVVISDYRMPQMNGLEFLTQVKNSNPDAIRLILSGYAESNDIKLGVQNNVIHKFLHKPWTDDLLIQHIKDAFKCFTTKDKL